MIFNSSLTLPKGIANPNKLEPQHPTGKAVMTFICLILYPCLFSASPILKHTHMMLPTNYDDSDATTWWYHKEHDPILWSIMRIVVVQLPNQSLDKAFRTQLAQLGWHTVIWIPVMVVARPGASHNCQWPMVKSWNIVPFNVVAYPYNLTVFCSLNPYAIPISLQFIPILLFAGFTVGIRLHPFNCSVVSRLSFSSLWNQPDHHCASKPAIQLYISYTRHIGWLNEHGHG